MPQSLNGAESLSNKKKGFTNQEVKKSQEVNKFIISDSRKIVWCFSWLAGTPDTKSTKHYSLRWISLISSISGEVLSFHACLGESDVMGL